MDTIKQAGYHHGGGILPFAILHRVWYTQLNNSEVGMEIYMRNYEIENEMYRRAVELSCIHRMEIITQVSALRLLTHLLFCASRQVQCLKHTNSMKR